MKVCKDIILAFYLLFVYVEGQGEICTFYHLEANCRYRIDGICLSEITASIDQCSDPIKVKFTISCERDPVVRFSHTFTTPDTIVSVVGFYTDVKLRVRLRMKEGGILNVEADVMAYGQSHTDLMNDDVKLHSLEEACGSLNEAGKIAIGVMAGLFVIAGIMLVVLLVIRRQRNILKAGQSRSTLVNEPETTPHRLSRIVENGFEEAENSQNIENSGMSVHNLAFQREVNQVQMQQTRQNSDRENTQEPPVRYSDIQRQQNEGNDIPLSPTLI